MAAFKSRLFYLIPAVIAGLGLYLYSVTHSTSVFAVALGVSAVIYFSAADDEKNLDHKVIATIVGLILYGLTSILFVVLALSKLS